MRRSSGILLPIFSLPSPYGIGTLGQEAYDFADFLHRARQSWWQILPVGPTGEGNSPYSGVSTYAGNPLLIDLNLLEREGLLTREELKSAQWGEQANRVDYEALYRAKLPLLRLAFERGYDRRREQVRAFEAASPWVADYALFQAIRERFHQVSWLEWPDEALRRRQEQALESCRRELEREVAFHTYVQYLFYDQWKKLKTYVNALGIQLIGDLPIYVSLDSADVWAAPENFQLDATGHPTAVAGVPPDYFCADGQLWGNPLYNWDAMKRDGYGWWIRRVDGASKLVDVIRIDHFRAFASYWSVPAGAKTAKEGAWVPGPGIGLLRTLTNWFSNVSYIAEDLGMLTPDVPQLRREAGLPGMKVLEFAFSGPDNTYLPHNYRDSHCVCYTGTHDNDTAAGWYQHATSQEQRFARLYLGLSDDKALPGALVRLGMGSTAELFISQIQDWLGLGSEGRINMPGVPKGNWRWRLRPGELTCDLADRIGALTCAFGRGVPPQTRDAERTVGPVAPDAGNL